MSSCAVRYPSTRVFLGSLLMSWGLAVGCGSEGVTLQDLAASGTDVGGGSSGQTVVAGTAVTAGDLRSDPTPTAADPTPGAHVTSTGGSTTTSPGTTNDDSSTNTGSGTGTGGGGAGGDPPPADDKETDPPPNDDTLGGVVEPPPALEAVTGLGLWPRTCDLDGMLDAFERASAAADLGMVQVTLRWDALHGDTGHTAYHTNYDYMVLPGWDDNRSLFDKSGLGKAIWIDFLASADRRYLNLSGYSGTAAFVNPDVAAAYVADCVWLADYFAPAYIALGTEIDEYLRVSSEAERAALLAAYVAAREEIQARHPNATVFIYFQYENVVKQDLWDLIRPFVAASDLAAFSTYPSLPYPGEGLTADTLPEDYYAPIATAIGARPPPAFVELGHPATSSELFATGSPDEQVAFVERVVQIAPRDTALVVWSHLYDPDYTATHPANIAQYFGGMGLLRRDANEGGAAWDSWVRFAGTGR